MKIVLAVTVFIVSLFSTLSIFAEESVMSSGQQQAAVSQAQPGVKTILSYKKELKITDKQEKELIRLMTGLQDNLTKKRKEITKLNSELANMINEKKSLKLIKRNIYNITRLQADALYADIEAARKIEDIFSKEQFASWKAIQAENQRELSQKAKEDQAKQQQGIAPDKK